MGNEFDRLVGKTIYWMDLDATGKVTIVAGDLPECTLDAEGNIQVEISMHKVVVRELPPERPGTREIREIAREILQVWLGINDYAKQYVIAMLELVAIEDKYGPAKEDGKEIVIRFLVNASSWRGADAKRIKKELQSLVK
jgi:hypothetical protein